LSYRHVVVTRFGGPEVLEVVEDRLPEPRYDEVRVRVLAAGVSFGDVLMRAGALPESPKPPFTPGYDIAGVVDKLGEGVASPALGQMVVAFPKDLGGYAEFVCVPAPLLVPVPDTLAPAATAAAALNYFVAYQMLHRIAKVQAGQRILVHGAAGGVGTALLELGALAGLEVYGTASKSKHDLVTQLGAVPIDYREEDFVAAVRRRPAGARRDGKRTRGGVHAAFDAIGGTNFWRSYRSLAPGGRLVAYGVSRSIKNGRRNRAVAVSSFLLVKLLGAAPAGRRAFFYTADSLSKRHPQSYREDLAAGVGLLEQEKIAPVVAKSLPLEEAAHAHELLEGSSVRGKIVLVNAEP